MRKSGILLPVSSLPSKYGIGCFSKDSFDQLRNRRIVRACPQGQHKRDQQTDKQYSKKAAAFDLISAIGRAGIVIRRL